MGTSGKRSILFVVSSLGVGGTERHLYRVATGLKERGFQISFFCFGPTGDIGTRLLSKGITVSSSQTRSSPRLARTLIDLSKTVRRSKPDIVHFFLPKAYLLGAPIAFLTGQRAMIMSRRSQNLYQKKHKIAGWFEHKLHRVMRFICGNSQNVNWQLQTEEGVPADKIRLIYNGIEAQSAPPLEKLTTEREKLGLDPKALTFIIVANLIPYKGHRDLLQALALIKNQLPENWQLLCVGRDDGIQPRLEELATNQDIRSHVHFTGQRDDIPSLLHLADIGLLVSHEEGFSNAVLEGMSAGLPMIVTDVGGNAEAVLNDAHGLVVAPQNPDQLSQALLKLALDPKLREKMGTAAKDRVTEHFSMAHCLDQYESLYQEVN